MGLDYIIRRVAKYAGMTAYNTNLAQRAVLLDIINQAADEIYSRGDLPIQLREVYIRSTSNKELTLPTFVGELRAIRSSFWNDKWELQSMAQRYMQSEWKTTWKNWRIVGESPVNADIANASPGTIEIAAADPTVVVTLVGETNDSNRAKETVILSSTSVAWTKSYFSYLRIYKNKITDTNIILKDNAGLELAILYADQLESRYLIVDVSQYPDLTGSECPDGTYAMEVLYKPRRNILYYDEDCFPLDGYDNIIVLKAKQILTEDEEGKEDRAFLMHQKSEMRLTQTIEDKSGPIQKRVRFKRNSMLGLFSRRYPSGAYAAEPYYCD